MCSLVALSPDVVYTSTLKLHPPSFPLRVVAINMTHSDFSILETVECWKTAAVLQVWYRLITQHENIPIPVIGDYKDSLWHNLSMGVL